MLSTHIYRYPRSEVLWRIFFSVGSMLSETNDGKVMAAFHWTSIISIYAQNANTLIDAKATSADTLPHLHNF